MRTQAKQWFITMPQCNLLPEAALSLWKKLGEVLDYVVAREDHKIEGKHLHAYLKFKNKIEWNETKFDIADFHGHYETCRSCKAVVKYCTKDGEFITNLNLEALSNKQSKKITVEMFDKDPIELVDSGLLNPMSLKNFIQNQNIYHELQRKLLMPKREARLEKKRHVWMYGPSNTGKTEKLRQFIEEYGEKNCFEIPSNDDWAAYKGEENVWFDEFKGQLTIQMLNKICDGYSKMNGKYVAGGISLNPNVKVVIVSNYSMAECYHKVDGATLETLSNRFNEVKMEKRAMEIDNII
nr:MAG: replication associated protein [Cressdnaviricota sp.]